VNQAPFFSIIIPTYNRAGLLGKAIKSVLGQTFKSWELLIIDDGSTDNTADVVKQFDDPRVRYIYQTNAERCVARNNGIGHAGGKYICFLDSDDYYLPERLSKIYNELLQRHNPVEMFYTGLTIEKENATEPREGNYYRGENIFEIIVVNTIHSQQVCVAAEIMQEYKYDPQFRIGEDMELWLRIAAKYPVNYLEKQYDVVVLEHEDRSVNIMRTNTGAEQLRLYHFIFTDAHSGKKISNKVKAYKLASSFHSMARFNLYRNKRFEAASAVFKAICTDWSSPWTKLRINVFLKLITFSSIKGIQKIMDVG